MANSAMKRLKKDLQELHDHPIVGANAEPDECNILVWYGLVVAPAGTKYAGIPIRFVLEFPPTYPNDAPKAFFETDIKYQGGLSLVTNGRISVCLSLFGNLAHVHTEWKSESTGWSPAYSVHTILLNMQALMDSEFISQNPHDVMTTAVAAKRFKCSKTGHDGEDPSKWAPQVLQDEAALRERMDELLRAAKAPAATSSGCPKCGGITLNLITSAKRLADEDPKTRLAQCASCESMFKLQLVEVPSSSSSSSSPAAAAAAVPDVGPLKNEFICYVSGSNVAEDKAKLGLGVHVENARSGMLSSEFEWLSLEAFESGTRHSTTNKPFEFWLPIHITDELWDEKLLAIRVREIAGGANLPTPKGSLAAITAAHVLRICSSLMTSALVGICMNAEKQTANDRFIKGFFALYRLMQRVAEKDRTIVDLANAKVRAFIEQPSERVKTKCPNLGELLVALVVSDKYTWADLAEAFQQENDTRNFFWTSVGNYNSPAPLPHLLQQPNVTAGRARAVFGATQTSRNLILFQVRFCNAAKALTREVMNAHYGLPPADLCAHLKQTHKDVSQVKDWDAYFEWLAMPKLTEAQRDQQLVQAQQRSQAQGYHGSGGGGGSSSNSYSRGGGRGGYRGGGGRGRY